MINLWNRLLKRLASRQLCFVPRVPGRLRRSRQFPVTQALESRALLSAAVVTDLQDYSPGSTAGITAWNTADTASANFDWSQAIQFQVIRTDGLGDLPNGNLLWYVTDGVGGFDGYYVDSNDDGTDDYGIFPDTDGAADSQIGTSWFVEDQYASSALRLIASQPANDENAFVGATATHDFTDSGNFSWSNSGTQTANVTAGGSAVSLTTAPVLTVPQNNGLVTPTISAVGVKAGSGGSATYVGALPSGLSVTVVATSDSDAANAVGTVNTGTSPGGTSRTITYAVTATATASTAAGTYVVGFTASNTGINSSSYEFTVIVTAGAGTGNLTVGTQSGTATYGAPTDSVSFFVDATRSGNGNFNGTYSVTGLPAGVTSSFSTSSFVVSGSTPLTDSTLTLAVDNTVNAGSYPFTVSLQNSAAGGSTYTATGTLVVDKAALTVTPTAGQSKVYGSADPTFAYTVSGLQNTDTVATAITGGVLGRAAGETVAGGPYAYTLGTLAANSNYTLSLGGTNSFAITKANATFTVTPYSATYDGSAKTATVGTITGVNGETGATVGTVNLSGTTHTNAGTYNNDAWTFTGGANYNNASGTVNNAIAKASTTTVVTITGGPFTYTGLAQTPATVTVTGAGGLSLTPTASYSNNLNAGTATASYTYAESANYLGSTDSKTFVIAKANATFTVAPYSATYDGSAKTATVGTITGVNGETGATVGTVNLSGTTHTNAGTYNNDAWTFTGSANYNNASGTVNNAITPATATVNVVDYTGVYDANSHTASVTITGVGGVTLASSSLTGTNVLESGSVTASTSDPNYDPATGTASLTITPATATVSVVDYTGVYDAGSHSAGVTITGVGGVTLASQDISGTNVVDSGSVTVSLSDSNYDPASGTATLTITPANATVNVVDYNGVYDGNSHTASVTITGVGGVGLASNSLTGTNVSQSGSVTASISDPNYDPATGTATLNITKATAVIAVTPYSLTYDGTSHTATGSATGVNSDNLAGLDLSGTVHTNAGSYSDSWIFIDPTGNYNDANGTVNNAIAKASTTTMVTINGGPFTYTGLAQTPATVTVTGAGGLNLTPMASYSNNLNAGTATASYTYAESANYLGSTDSKTFVIAKANATFTVTPYNVEYDGVSHTATVGTITGVNGESGSTVGTVNLSGTTHTNAGTYTDSWTFTATANYNSSSGQIIDVITVEKDVVTRYIGQTTFVTSGTSSTTAQVTLTASIVDPDNTALIGATVDFIDVTSGKILAAGVKVAQVAGQPSSGTANAVVTLSSGQYGSQEYVILAKLSGGNYDNSSQALADKTATIVVSKPAAATEIISGGIIANLAGKAGTYGTTASGQTSFSVGLKYNKSGTNPQGKVSLSIKQSDGSTIYIKSNSITSIAATSVTGGKSSTVYTKASIYRIANDGTMTTIDGNVTLRLDLLDLTGTANDTIGFTALSTKDSTMYYSNDWFYDTLSKTWKTRNQAFSGNLTIA